MVSSKATGKTAAQKTATTTMDEAAAELAERSHMKDDQQHWMDWLLAQVDGGNLATRDGLLDPEDVNKLLRADPAFERSTIRLASPIEDALHQVGWFDATMHADHWFAMGSVSPREAASLLCQSDPLDPGAAPDLTSNGETTPEDFALMARVFEDEALRTGVTRPLTDWLEIARSRGCRVHSWIRKYLEAAAQLGGLKSDGGNGITKRWTDEYKSEVRAYRDAHGLKATAEHYKVSQATISKHVPAGKPAKQAFGPWGQLAKTGKK